MTTDRPSATRAAVPPQRTSADRQSAPPADAFSALLGAAAPRTDDAQRPDASRSRRDDAQRLQRRDDNPRLQRREDAQRPQRADEPKPKPAAAQPADEQPKADAPAEPTTEQPTETAPRPVNPDIFALQLASPLPTTPTAVPNTGTPLQGAPVQAAAGETVTPATPAFPPLNLLPGAASATPVTEAPTGEATTPATAPGGIPMPFLAGLTPGSQADLPNIELPATPPTEVPADAAATPQFDASALLQSTGEQTSSDTPQQQQQNPQASAQSAQQAKPADAPAPATTAPITQAAPVAQAMPMQNASGLQRAVPLYRAPESAAHMIQIAAEKGVTHARLNLKPVELGGIEVRLHSTSQGITAQLVADSPEAAKLLTQAADDLRRDLADRDVNLLSLDVTTQQQFQDQQQAGSRQADIFGDALNPGNTRTVRFGPQDDAGLTETAATADTSLVLPNGVLVDVLA